MSVSVNFSLTKEYRKILKGIEANDDLSSD